VVLALALCPALCPLFDLCWECKEADNVFVAVGGCRAHEYCHALSATRLHALEDKRVYQLQVRRGAWGGSVLMPPTTTRYTPLRCKQNIDAV
jgi:hypothetical protein